MCKCSWSTQHSQLSERIQNTGRLKLQRYSNMKNMCESQKYFTVINSRLLEKEGPVFTWVLCVVFLSKHHLLIQTMLYCIPSPAIKALCITFIILLSIEATLSHDQFVRIRRMIKKCPIRTNSYDLTRTNLYDLSKPT